MNALVSIDVATLTPSTVFTPGGVEAIVSKIEAEVLAEVFTLETAEGRERIKSVAYKVARSKTALDDMGKELVAGIKAQAATIDADRRTIRDRLDALKESVRGPLTAWEDAEAERIANHEGVLVWITQACQFECQPTAADIKLRIEALDNETARDWQEFAERGSEATEASRTKLFIMLEAAEQRERDAAELAELRRMKAEREAADAAAAEAAQEAERKSHDQRLDKFALPHERVGLWTERVYAEQEAERQRQRDAQQAERDRQNAERADRQAIEAATRAVEQERERAARVKADEERAAAKREANKKHRAKVHTDIRVALGMLEAAPHIVDRIIDAIAAGEIPHVSITY